MDPSAKTPKSQGEAGRRNWCAAILIIVLLSVGLLLWTTFFGNKEQRPVDRQSSVEDPRRAYEGVFQNIHPDVKYVGTKACGKCHGHAEIFAQTPMGRSLIPIAELVESHWYDSAHHNPIKKFDSILSVDRDGPRLWHNQTWLDEKEMPIIQDKRAVHYAIGSGNHGHSFLSLEGDGYLFQTPISWFGKKQQFWDVSPGFVSFNRRAVGAECLFCHADRATPKEDFDNRFHVPEGGWHAIGCERCHGPGEKHVKNPGLKDLTDAAGTFKKNVLKADPTIVNPGKLVPILAEAVCQQCHLEGEVRVIRRGRGIYDYRPGLPLDPFWSVFVDGHESGEDKKAVNHVEQMVLSRCYQQSKGDNKLGCITCHDPHHVPVKEAERIEYFREKCWKCHAPGVHVENGKKPCTELLTKRQEKQDNCLACHMRPYGTSDIAHAASTDHRILRLPEKGKPNHPFDSNQDAVLMHFHQGKVDEKDIELLRDLGIALSRSSFTKRNNRALVQATDMLERSLQNFPDDLESWKAKGSALLNQGRFSEALAAFETLLAKKPENELALSNAAGIAQILGEQELATTYLKKLASLNPWEVSYQDNLTKLLVRHGAWREVGTPCRQWLSLNPANVEARKILVEYLIRSGEEREASAELAKLGALRPKEREGLQTWFADLKKRKSKK